MRVLFCKDEAQYARAVHRVAAFWGIGDTVLAPEEAAFGVLDPRGFPREPAERVVVLGDGGL